MITIKCDYCGKEKKTYPSLIREKNYCNQQCCGMDRREKFIFNCLTCGKELLRPKYYFKQRNFCSQECSSRCGLKGRGINTEANIKRIHKRKRELLVEKYRNNGPAECIDKGYVLVSVLTKSATKQLPKHHYIWIRDSDWHFIPKGYCVHHIDGDKINNTIENLVCIPRGIHAAMHNIVRSGGVCFA